jgi:hypothetical protein
MRSTSDEPMRIGYHRPGFAFLMLTTRDDRGDSIGFGGRRW